MSREPGPAISLRADQPRRRVASLTVGQTPRCDLFPDILEHMPIVVEVQEFGALDGLTDLDIAALAPRAEESSLITRLRDGRDVIVSRQRVAERLEAICREIDPRQFDLVIVLSTGLFREFESPCPMVNAQRAMDAAIAAMAASGQTVGVIYPLYRQVIENAGYSAPGLALRFSHAASGNAEELRLAADELAGCDLVMLNSVGFNEADRVAIASRTGRPVILARRVVAGAIRLLLDPGGTRIGAPPAPPVQRGDATTDRIQGLTPRERQVMSLVAEGLSNKAIARQLAISPRTVEIHRAKMMAKMGAASVGALIRMVLTSQHPGL